MAAQSVAVAMIRSVSSMKAFILSVGLIAASCARQSDQPSFERIYALEPQESVFAYARIAPDGRFLAYASRQQSESGDAPGGVPTVKVVDVARKSVVFQERGVDAYWSNDGRRLIFLSTRTPEGSVTIRHHNTGVIVRDVAPVSLGAYFSWGVRDGRDIVLTIQGNYYYLDGDRAVPPAGRVSSCEGTGPGSRPLLSKDGARISTFMRGHVVVRHLTDCQDMVDTAIQGAKADFSFDGRYIAFHAAGRDGSNYEIKVVDTLRRSVRTLEGLPGSSLFPSWTADGRLCFRYDAPDYRGFVMARNVLASHELPLPEDRPRVASTVRWGDLFKESGPTAGLTLVIVWAPWSAHSLEALRHVQEAGRLFEGNGAKAQVAMALEPNSNTLDAARMLEGSGLRLRELKMMPEGLALSGALNQIPSVLLFRNEELVDSRLGLQTLDDLRDWLQVFLSGH